MRSRRDGQTWTGTMMNRCLNTVLFVWSSIDSETVTMCVFMRYCVSRDLFLYHDALLLQITEQEFMAGFGSVYSAACPEVDWAGELPEGAFSEYESRGAVIPQGEYRATTLGQLRSLAALIKQVLGIRTFIDDNKYSTSHGESITWPMINM